jgi:GntR family transcriptional regulator
MSAMNVRNNRRSIAEQLREELLEMLRAEQYPAGSRIPSEQELVERFAVSRATVREVLKGLVLAGQLDCRHGKGYFVLSPESVIHKPVTQLQSVTELMADMGYPVENRVLHMGEEHPSRLVRRELQLTDGQTILRLERVRLSRELPLIYSIDIFPRDLVPGDWKAQSWSGSLLQFFSEVSKTHIVSSRAVIRAMTLNADLCAQIGVPSQTAWLCMEQLNLTRTGRPVLFSQDYHRGEKFQFYVTRRRLL